MSEQKTHLANMATGVPVVDPIRGSQSPKCLMLITSTDQALVKEFATRLSTRLEGECGTFITEDSGTRHLPQVLYSALLSAPDSCSAAYLLSTLAEMEDELTKPGTMSKAYDLEDFDAEDLSD